MEEERVSRTDASAIKAEERSSRLEEICREQMEAWQTHLLTLQTERSTREAAWQARRLLLEGRALEVSAVADEKIAAGRERAGTSGSNTGAEAQTTQSNAQLGDAVAELERFKKEAAAAAAQAAGEPKLLTDRLAALEQAKATNAASPAARKSPARLSDNFHTHCSLAVVYSDDELPVLRVSPDKETKRNLALVSANLAHWAQAGMIPATFRDLMSGSTESQIPATLTLLEEVVGEQIWERFFQGVDVTLAQYVPFQLGSILNTALARSGAVLEKCEKEWDFADRAKGRFAELMEEDAEAKRLRTGTGPYAPSPY